MSPPPAAGPIQPAEAPTHAQRTGERADHAGLRPSVPGKRRVTTRTTGVGAEPPASPPSAPGDAPTAPPAQADVERNPLVRSVLEVFEGEIKRVHPKNH